MSRFSGHDHDHKLGPGVRAILNTPLHYVCANDSGDESCACDYDSLPGSSAVERPSVKRVVEGSIPSPAATLDSIANGIARASHDRFRCNVYFAGGRCVIEAGHQGPHVADRTIYFFVGSRGGGKTNMMRAVMDKLIERGETVVEASPEVSEEVRPSFPRSCDGGLDGYHRADNYLQQSEAAARDWPSFLGQVARALNVRWRWSTRMVEGPAAHAAIQARQAEKMWKFAERYGMSSKRFAELMRRETEVLPHHDDCDCEHVDLASTKDRCIRRKKP